jgi:hypothetical protein
VDLVRDQVAPFSWDKKSFHITELDRAQGIEFRLPPIRESPGVGAPVNLTGGTTQRSPLALFSEVFGRPAVGAWVVLELVVRSVLDEC